MRGPQFDGIVLGLRAVLDDCRRVPVFGNVVSHDPDLEGEAGAAPAASAKESVGLVILPKRSARNAAGRKFLRVHCDMCVLSPVSRIDGTRFEWPIITPVPWPAWPPFRVNFFVFPWRSAVEPHGILNTEVI